MIRFIYFTATLLFISIGMTGCDTGTRTAELTEEEQYMKFIPYMYFSKDGYELKLSQKEALNLGISAKVYENMMDNLVKGNKMIFENVNRQASSKEDFKAFFYCSKDRVDTTGMPSYYYIIDPVTRETFDHKGEIVPDVY